MKVRIAVAAWMIWVCSLSVSFATFAQTQAAPPLPSLEGAFSGTLQAGDAELHLVLHLSKASDGSPKGTLDSLDQAVYGMEITSIARTGSTLRFSISNVAASFEGKISADHQTIEGTWTQGVTSLPLTFHRQAPGAKKPADAVATVEGTWQGALETKGMRYRLQLHVTHDDKGHLLAALDSIDQGVNGVPASNVSQIEANFHFEIPAIGATYDGTLNAAKNAITGTWTSTEEKEKLNLQRSDKVLELRRPQNPSKPYPYREEEVTFSNSNPNLNLSGTLTLPRGVGPFAAALLIAGSGPHDRDESLAGHRPFLVLSDFLTRKGFAVLRYDKRGLGKSTGSYAEATTQDFAADAEAAIAYLKTRKEIDPHKIGLIGHSEGGLIAPMLASNRPGIAWVVLLSAPSTTGEETLLTQSELIARAAGMTEEQVARSLNFDKEAYALVRSEKEESTLEQKVNELVESSGLSAAMPPAALQSQIKMIGSPWFRFFLDYDPVPALQKIVSGSRPRRRERFASSAQDQSGADSQGFGRWRQQKYPDHRIARSESSLSALSDRLAQRVRRH